MWTGSFVALFTAALATAQPAAPTASVGNGNYIGTFSAFPSATAAPYGVNKYLGIPYAAMPLTRFQPAQLPPTLTGNQKAQTYGSACIQGGADMAFPGVLPQHPDLPPDSEDCLFVNVYAPTSATETGSLPVMFFIYGGSFVTGNGSTELYDGSYLAASQNVLVVTINYRVNIFGFPGTLNATDLPETSRNLGLLDIRLALDWVKNNIAGFGGDGTKITVFAESSGSMAADLIALTTSPSSIPFRGMIMESGTYYTAKYGAGVVLSNVSIPLYQPKDIVNSLGCPWPDNTISCLSSKSITAAQIKTALYDYPIGWGPTEDGGRNVPAGWRGQIVRTSGGGARIPMLTGTNANEGALFTFQDANTDWSEFFHGRFPELNQPARVQSIEAAYANTPCPADHQVSCEWYQATQALTDYMYTCLAAREARANAAAGVKTWRYVYDTAPPGWGGLVPHAFELPQVFGTYDPAQALPAQKSISAVIQKAWADFAKDPSGNGPGWTAYSGAGAATGEKVAHLGSTPESGTMVEENAEVSDFACSFYDDVYERNDPSAGKMSRVFKY